MGSSPERLVQVEQGKITVNPIAGTRKGGQDKEEAKLAQELLNDAKELAEHDMLLESRAKGCEPRSPDWQHHRAQDDDHRVFFPCDAHGFYHGRQSKAGLPSDRLLGTCFPAGTVSGAP